MAKKAIEKARIRIGNQTAYSASNITLPFRYAVSNNFDAFEWFPDKKGDAQGWLEHDIGYKTRYKIKQIANEHDISLSVHAPWQANPLKQQEQKMLLNNIDFARDLGATLFNIHLNIEAGIDAFIQAIIPIITYLKQNNIRLSIENTPFTNPEDFNELFEKLDDLNSHMADDVGMCLDIGHANLCQKTLNDYIGFMDHLDLKVPIIHVHIHENYGDYDSHLSLFTGPSAIDPSGIKGLLARLLDRDFFGAIIMEQWPKPTYLLDNARSRLKEMLWECLGPWKK